MRSFSAFFAAILFLLVAGTATSSAQTRVLSGLTVDIPVAGTTVTVMIASYERHGGGSCPTGTCCKSATVTLYDTPYFSMQLLNGASFPALTLNGNLANGRAGSVSLTGVRILSVLPTTVNGRAAWTIEFCYDRQVVSLGGQELE